MKHLSFALWVQHYNTVSSNLNPTVLLEIAVEMAKRKLEDEPKQSSEALKSLKGNSSQRDGALAKKKPRSGDNAKSQKKPMSWSVTSLHISQLPFDASKPKLAAHFEAHGCKISEDHGIRMVFAPNGDFTGVAFLDVKDEKSMNDGLKLHRTRFGGRLINVRPTKSKNELAEIVLKRDADLAAKGLDFKLKPALSKMDKAVMSREAGVVKEKVRKPILTEDARQVLDSRDKWSKSKKARERARLKKRVSQTSDGK
jgi:RNA recognition motif-containing protein